MLTWLPEDVSTFGVEIDSLFYLIYYITAATFILVTVLMVVFLIKYHPRVAQRAGQFHALLKHFDRTRYVALAEKGPGFAEDASVALAFFGGFHEDY